MKKEKLQRLRKRLHRCPVAAEPQANQWIHVHGEDLLRVVSRFGEEIGVASLSFSPTSFGTELGDPLMLHVHQRLLLFPHGRFVLLILKLQILGV